MTEPPISSQASGDGTRKYRFSDGHGGQVETVYIPEGARHTLCISSQTGCRMGCAFCMTGIQGFSRHLDAAHILNQVRSVPERPLLTNIVFMGMGEPLDNLDAVLESIAILTSPAGFNIPPRRIAVSTVGIASAIRTYLENCRSPLAVSVHSPFPNERRQLMPVEKASPLKDVLDAIRSTPRSSGRRIFFEYIVFKGINHTRHHADALAALLDGMNGQINLIRYHPVPGLPFQSPDDTEILAFRDALKQKGFFTSIRRSRGLDIQAACGLLSATTKPSGDAPWKLD